MRDIMDSPGAFGPELPWGRWAAAEMILRRFGGETEQHVRTALHRQIDATDRQIDQLVYELYGLNDDEIKLMEAATS